MQISETSSGPTIKKEERHFAEMIEKICLLLAFPNAKYKDTQRDFEEERQLYLFPYSFFDSANGKLCPFYFEISRITTLLVWESVCISIQRHFIQASENLVKKDTAGYDRQMFKPSKIPLYKKFDEEEVMSIRN